MHNIIYNSLSTIIRLLRPQKIIPLFLFPFLFSCQNDEVQATNSLKGSWKVVSASSSYAYYTDAGGHGGIDSIQNDSGDLGFFNFKNDLVDYSFMRHDTIREGSGEWNLSACKVRDGFSRETLFSLEIPHKYIFDTQFENGTKNSEKNAKSMTLSQYPMESGQGVFISLELEKL